jgi:hypothetical protein
MTPDTHGRWPLVGAVALIPTSAAALRRPALRPFAALLWHQTEEWVWPGSFLPWINREVLGSEDDEFPIDRRLGFAINVLFGWGTALWGAFGPAPAAPAAMLYASNLGNLGLHASWAVRHRRYNPGTVTAVVTLTPVAVTGLRALVTDPEVSPRPVKLGVVGGVLMSVVLVPALKWRLRRRA